MSSITIATASYDRNIRLWEARTGRALRQFTFHDSQVNCMTVSQDRVRLAAGGNPMIRLYDISPSAQPINQQYTGTDEGKHTGNVTALGFLRSAGAIPLLWSTSEDGHVKLWEARTPSMRLRRDADSKSPINCATIMPDQRYLFTGSQLGTIAVWPMAQQHREQQQPDGSTAAAASSTEWSSLQELPLVTGGVGGEDVPIRTISVSPNSDFIVVGTNSGHIHCLRFKADEDRALGRTAPTDETGGANQILLAPFHSFQAHQKYVLRCHVSPVGNALVTTSADYSIALWDVPEPHLRYGTVAGNNNNSQQKAAVTGSSGPPFELGKEGSPASSTVGADSKTDMSPTSQGPAGFPGSPTASDAGGVTASTGGGKGVKSSGLAGTAAAGSTTPAWTLSKTLTGHSRWVWDCSFSSCGQFLVSASSDHTARLWNVKESKVIVSYNHQKPVTCVVVEDRKVEAQ